MDAVSSQPTAVANAPTIFISHSERDQTLAEALIRFLVTAGICKDDDIRCTSSPGYGARQGEVAKVVRNDLSQCAILIALFTPESVKSGWVWMECGAVWLLNPDRIIPVFASRALFNMVQAPITAHNAVIGGDPRLQPSLLTFLTDVTQRHHLPLKMTPHAVAAMRTFEEALTTAAVGADAIAEGTYCGISYESSKARNSKPLTVAKEGQDTLFHTYLHIKDNIALGRVHYAVQVFFSIVESEIYDGVLWSLLGSMELAVTFRAAPRVGEKVQEELIQYIRDVRALGDSDLTETDIHHHKLEREFNWEGGRYTRDRRTPELEFLESDRITHAFIKLEYRENDKLTTAQAQNDLQSAIGQLKRIFERENRTRLGQDAHVDLYGVTECGKFVICEMHLPCGRQSSIKRLSKVLEAALAKWNKHTFIVYDMKVLGESPIA